MDHHGLTCLPYSPVSFWGSFNSILFYFDYRSYFQQGKQAD